LGKKDRFITGLDIGTTKTVALVGEVVDNAVRFVAFGASESRGWRRGQIVNLDLAVSSIRRAIEVAETALKMPVENAIIGVAGANVRGLNSRGGVNLGHRPRDVQRDDIRRSIDAARNVTLPQGLEILHVLPQEFILDSRAGIREPLGMIGQRLEANVHVVTAPLVDTQNVVTAVNRAGIVVSDTVFEVLASADACLTQDERELGCCLLDIGGGPAEMAVYTGGFVRHTAAFPLGGDHFTNDLAVILRTPVTEAERIKREIACAFSEIMGEDEPVEIASVGDRPPRTVFKRSVCEVIESRAQELFTFLRDDLRRAGLDKQIPAGLVLTGGGAQLRGLPELAEKFFSLPVRVASPRGFEGMTEAVARPEYATAVGLVLYGARARRMAAQQSNGFRGWMRNFFGS
jgi:cell division protein FtsA